MDIDNERTMESIDLRLSKIERRVYGQSNPSFKEKQDAASEVDFQKPYE